MLNDIIKAIVYTELNEGSGPSPILWNPIDLPEKLRMSVAIKTITMLTTDQGAIPKSLVIMPFPSFNLKGIVKYIESQDDKFKGGTALSTITLLFSEADDLIFYKYMEYLESAFTEIAQKIIMLKSKNKTSNDIFFEINNLYLNISEILNDLQKKENSTSDLEAFPEEEMNDELEVTFNFKLVVCGDPGVGKTSTILRFTDDAFTRTYIPTLGVNISEKNVKMKNALAKLIIWDIAGQIKFEAMRRHFYKGAEAVILIFDLTNRKSYQNIVNWYRDMEKNIIPVKDKILGFILGNKEDLVNGRTINPEEPLLLAEQLNLKYLEISALTGKNVEEMFLKLTDTLINSKN
ncbi:MAG: GTP-binding protein [Promethearchaeota archaeon]|nr:MAG: GTP-binding protein [Candidatus Lokiarchaeota archaeon]